jgi:hypothetical protein
VTIRRPLPGLQARVIRDPDREIDGPVGDLPVADRDVDGVDEHHRIETITGLG